MVVRVKGKAENAIKITHAPPSLRKFKVKDLRAYNLKMQLSTGKYEYKD